MEENNILNNLRPFYNGEEVICVITHPSKIVIKDNKYIVEQCFKCGCGEWRVVIFNIRNQNGTKCTECYLFDQTTYFNANRFKSLQQKSFPLIKLTKVIEKEKELLSAN